MAIFTEKNVKIGIFFLVFPCSAFIGSFFDGAVDPLKSCMYRLFVCPFICMYRFCCLFVSNVVIFLTDYEPLLQLVSPIVVSESQLVKKIHYIFFRYIFCRMLLIALQRTCSNYISPVGIFYAIFAGPIFRLTLLTFRPQKRDKQVASSGH